MEPAKIKFKTVDEYLSTFPEETRNILEGLRQMIRQVVPQAEEVISYNMPAFKLNGILVYYAGYKKHIGFYPASVAMEVFKDRLTDYKTSKGAIQFPIEKEIPRDLVKDIVEFRIKEVKNK